ncbi:MAG: indolepyruvate oxidoreductase subunit beta [Dehalococcoidia bacterium]|nr:indolepyruvate oxidoreductase subunit beta [Dehalococcoidia bacterium]
MKDVNVLMVGVGGQGVILASDALAEIGMKAGYDVKKTDSLGMAQRGGSVVSNVRWGQNVFSPMIKKGEVDFLIGFEEIEAARWASYLSPGGVAIVADVTIIPVSSMSGGVPYPGWDKIKSILAHYTEKVYLLPAARIGEEVKNPRALNMVMMGAIAAFLDLKDELWLEDIRRKVPPKFLDSSIQAFHKGAQVTQSMKEKGVSR